MLARLFLISALSIIGTACVISDEPVISSGTPGGGAFNESPEGRDGGLDASCVCDLTLACDAGCDACDWDCREDAASGPDLEAMADSGCVNLDGEDNHGSAVVTALGMDDGGERHLCPGRDDWYGIEVGEGQALPRIALVTPTELTLRLYGPDDKLRMHVLMAADESHDLSMPSEAQVGTWKLRLRSADLASAYTLSLEATDG